jgi:hypothetical protein
MVARIVATDDENLVTAQSCGKGVTAIQQINPNHSLGHCPNSHDGTTSYIIEGSKRVIEVPIRSMCQV